jgi:tetratricopeptide (TPR) repeat protein
LRQKQISAPSSEASQLPERASIVAAALLQVPVKGTGNVGQAIEHVSPAAYQDFAVAEELRQQPNDTKLDEAIAHYRRALDLDSNFALGYARIAMSYIRKFQITHEPAALRLAERNSDRALQLAPDLAQSRLSRALVDLYSGKTQVAMEAMSRAQRADPANTEILMYEARAFEDLGEPVQEEAKFRSVLQQRPNFWPAYNQLGRVLYRQGRVPDALKAFQDASTVAPHVALPLANAGSMYLRLKRKDDAIEMFQKSLRAAPNEIAYLNLGGMAFEDRDYAKALDYYDKARDLNPRNHLTFRNIADCYDAMGKPSLTKENYARAADLMAEELKTNSRQGGAWMRLAFYDAKAGRQDRVDAELQAAQERGADDVVSQFLKAQTMAVIGRKEEAVQLVLACLTRGLSPVDVELALDLKEVRADSRYRKRIGK